MRENASGAERERAFSAFRCGSGRVRVRPLQRSSSHMCGLSSPPNLSKTDGDRAESRVSLHIFHRHFHLNPTADLMSAFAKSGENERNFADVRSRVPP